MSTTRSLLERIVWRWQQRKARKLLTNDSIFVSLCTSAISRFGGDDGMFSTANFQSAFHKRFGFELGETVAIGVMARSPVLLERCGKAHWKWIGPTSRL